MDRRDPETDAVLQITGLTLPSYRNGCACGARTVDLFGYPDHDHFRARCTACGVWDRDWIEHAVLGDKRDGRPRRFEPSPSNRFAIFRRDKFCCVHCGRPAPRAGDAFSEIRRLLVAHAGSERSLAVARDAHASTCLQCGQVLPGILQSIPFEIYRTLSARTLEQLWDILERGRLTIDHLIPYTLLEIDGVVVGKKEADLVRDTLLVTACRNCNWGRRDALERWDEISQLLMQRILPARRDAADIRGYAGANLFSSTSGTPAPRGLGYDSQPCSSRVPLIARCDRERRFFRAMLDERNDMIDVKRHFVRFPAVVRNVDPDGHEALALTNRMEDRFGIRCIHETGPASELDAIHRSRSSWYCLLYDSEPCPWRDRTFHPQIRTRCLWMGGGALWTEARMGRRSLWMQGTA
jgi:5-methylcytosine-specific restriction endonuclease McrA